MRYEISTEMVAPADRYEFWADRMMQVMGTTTIAPPKHGEPFSAKVSAVRRGALLYLEYSGDGRPVARRDRGIAHVALGGYWLYRDNAAATAASHFTPGGREYTTREHDLLVGDADVPYEIVPRRRYDSQAWLVPRHLLDPHLPKLSGPLSMALPIRAGLGALAVSYLDSIGASLDSLDDAALPVVMETLSRLIAVACGTAAGAYPDAVREGRLAEAKRHIDRHLADPALSPASVAAAMGIAVRTLHALFEPAGTTFARHVQRRRLEECRAALLAYPTRPVTDIAYAWGFTSLSSFYRAFQAAFGAAPNDLRMAALLGR